MAFKVLSKLLEMLMTIMWPCQETILNVMSLKKYQIKEYSNWIMIKCSRLVLHRHDVHVTRPGLCSVFSSFFFFPPSPHNARHLWGTGSGRTRRNSSAPGGTSLIFSSVCAEVKAISNFPLTLGSSLAGCQGFSTSCWGLCEDGQY